MLNKLRIFSKTKIAAVLVAIIIVPFVLWGRGSVFSGGNTNSIAKIDNVNISTKDFLDHISEYANKSKVVIKLDPRYLLPLAYINEFMFKNLKKELKLINDSINQYFNMNLELHILFKEVRKDNVKNKEVGPGKDNEHPLVMDALNKFEGEIIR